MICTSAPSEGSQFSDVPSNITPSAARPSAQDDHMRQTRLFDVTPSGRLHMSQDVVVNDVVTFSTPTLTPGGASVRFDSMGCADGTSPSSAFERASSLAAPSQHGPVPSAYFVIEPSRPGQPSTVILEPRSVGSVGAPSGHLSVSMDDESAGALGRVISHAAESATRHNSEARAVARANTSPCYGLPGEAPTDQLRRRMDLSADHEVVPMEATDGSVQYKFHMHSLPMLAWPDARTPGRLEVGMYDPAVPDSRGTTLSSVMDMRRGHWIFDLGGRKAGFLSQKVDHNRELEHMGNRRQAVEGVGAHKVCTHGTDSDGRIVISVLGNPGKVRPAGVMFAAAFMNEGEFAHELGRSHQAAGLRSFNRLAIPHDRLVAAPRYDGDANVPRNVAIAMNHGRIPGDPNWMKAYQDYRIRPAAVETTRQQSSQEAVSSLLHEESSIAITAPSAFPSSIAAAESSCAASDRLLAPTPDTASSDSLLAATTLVGETSSKVPSNISVTESSLLVLDSARDHHSTALSPMSSQASQIAGGDSDVLIVLLGDSSIAPPVRPAEVAHQPGSLAAVEAANLLSPSQARAQRFATDVKNVRDLLDSIEAGLDRMDRLLAILRTTPSAKHVRSAPPAQGSDQDASSLPVSPDSQSAVESRSQVVTPPAVASHESEINAWMAQNGSALEDLGPSPSEMGFDQNVPFDERAAGQADALRHRIDPNAHNVRARGNLGPKKIG